MPVSHSLGPKGPGPGASAGAPSQPHSHPHRRAGRTWAHHWPQFPHLYSEGPNEMLSRSLWHNPVVSRRPWPRGLAQSHLLTRQVLHPPRQTTLTSATPSTPFPSCPPGRLGPWNLNLGADRARSWDPDAVEGLQRRSQAHTLLRALSRRVMRASPGRGQKTGRRDPAPPQSELRSQYRQGRSQPRAP